MESNAIEADVNVIVLIFVLIDRRIIKDDVLHKPKVIIHKITSVEGNH